jgi:hypothetical protein
MEVQLSMGFLGVPEVTLPTPVAVVEALVPRPPGWELYATKKGTVGWHRQRLSGPWGLSLAWCGQRGRVVADLAEEIICCQACITAESMFE